MSYLLSKFLRSLVISALFFWMRISCYFSSFFNSITLSSYQSCPVVCFFFLRSRSFSAISSILAASSFSCPLSLTCCSMSLALLSYQSVTLRFLPFDCYIQYSIGLMITIFAEKAQLLSKKPSELISITHSFLKEAAAYHHPHNKLLPAQYIKQLMGIFETYSLTSSNIDTAYQLLASSSLSVLLRANFNQLAQNKLFGALILQYTVILQNLTAEIKGELPEIFSYFKFASRGLVLSKIINKLLERTHSFLPQFYRFARVLVEVMGNLIQSLSSIDSEEDQFGKLDLQQNILRMCFSKKVNFKSLVFLLKGLLQQLKHESIICAPSSQILIVSLIKEKCQQIFSSLPAQYKIIMEEEEEDGTKQDKNENIYLEQTIAVRELTPRMYDDEHAFIVNKLRKSKLKLKKKIENDLRKDVLVRQQEAQILQDVRKEKIDRQHKKELYVIEKQTAQARKFHKSMEKVKKIRKEGKGKQGSKLNFGDKGRRGKMGEKNKSAKINKHKLGFKK